MSSQLFGASPRLTQQPHPLDSSQGPCENRAHLSSSDSGWETRDSGTFSAVWREGRPLGQACPACAQSQALIPRA